MKKILNFGLLSLACLSLASCSFNDIFSCNVTYNMCNGEASIVQTASKLQSVDLLSDVKRDNCTFEGWYSDPFYENKITSLVVTSDIELYAKWSVNDDYLQTILDSNNKNAVVTYYEVVNEGFSSLSTQGTAFVFDQDDKYYYLLTNNHVTADNDNYKIIFLNNDTIISNKASSITFTDPYTNKSVQSNYKATVDEVYSDEDYDLSILRISKTIKSYGIFQTTKTLSLGVTSFANESLRVSDIVVSYGSPEGERRTLTGGLYLGDKEVMLQALNTHVTFDVNIHTSYINNGSSGGPLFNEFGEVVGVNYAGSTTQNSGFVWGAAVPLDKVHEFLNNSGYNK